MNFKGIESILNTICQWNVEISACLQSSGIEKRHEKILNLICKILMRSLKPFAQRYIPLRIIAETGTVKDYKSVAAAFQDTFEVLGANVSADDTILIHLMNFTKLLMKETMFDHFELPKRDTHKDYMLSVGVCWSEDIAFSKSYYKLKHDIAMKLIPGAFLEHVTEELELQFKPIYLYFARAFVDDIYSYLEYRYHSIISYQMQKLVLPENSTIDIFLSMVRKRKQQLEAHGFSPNKVEDIVNGEQEFLECEFLDQFEDKECVAIFRFDKLTIKYLTLVLMIPHEYTMQKSQLKADGNRENKTTSYKIHCDPIIQLMIYLYRNATANALPLASNFFKMAESQILKVESNVLNWIYLNFSHLLNIDNCVYNERYLKLLVEKSKVNLPGVKDYTCYAIDGTHVKIAKPNRVDNVGYDITLDGTKSSDTLSYQCLTDMLGMYIDVTTLNVVGDSAYGANLGLDNLYSVPKRAEARGIENRCKQKNLSKVRCSIEQVFGKENSIFKVSGAKLTNKLDVNQVDKTYVVDCFLSNIREILYTSTTSEALSDVLPVDLYCHLWGALSYTQPLFESRLDWIHELASLDTSNVNLAN
ncbi:hypothetical protein ACO0OL_002040 [Hanseniaspora opuntiae]